MIVNLTDKKQLSVYIKLLALPTLIFIVLIGLFIASRVNEGNKKVVLLREHNIVCYDSTIPQELKVKLAEHIPSFSTDNSQVTTQENKLGDSTTECAATIKYNLADTDLYTKVWTKLYIPIVPQQSTISDITTNAFQSAVISRTVNLNKIVWDDQVDPFMKAKFDLGSGYTNIPDDYVYQLLNTARSTIAIVPFEQLTTRYKILPINGQSPTQKTFNIANYPLAETYWIRGDDTNLNAQLTTSLQDLLGPENYLPNKISDIIMTGSSRVAVGAQYSALASKKDFAFPVRTIADTLTNADITHISLDNTLFTGCDPVKSKAQYICSTTQAISALQLAGVDVVGLTSEHMLDFDISALKSTMELLDSKGIKHYGAGENSTQAEKSVIITKNGVKFAFLGANFVPTWYGAWATSTKAGTANYQIDDLKARIRQAKTQADFVLVDMQWGSEYSNKVESYQKEYAHAAIESGATVVTGVHTSEVGPVEYYKSGLIFYSLGDFISDRISAVKYREGVAVRHIFYDGHYLGYEVLPVYNSDKFQLQPADKNITSAILDKMF